MFTVTNMYHFVLEPYQYVNQLRYFPLAVKNKKISQAFHKSRISSYEVNFDLQFI